MFTGIVERTGTIVSLTETGGVHRLTVAAPGIAGQLREGDSLAVSGVCLTALNAEPDLSSGELFHADLAAETLARTSLGSLAPGAQVNLELPVAAGSPLGGHIVQGHVDGTGVLVGLEPVAPESPQNTDWTLRVRVPEQVRQWMVLKGSVAIEGISLTIAGWDGEVVSIAILPLTYWRTNLHTLAVGAPINVEADVLVKLAWQRMEEAKKPELALTESWLVAEGF